MAWFRVYEGMASDAKFHLIARKSGQPVAFAIAVWIALLERASAAAHRGEVAGFDCESCDAALGMPDGATQAIYCAMEAKGMIADGRIARWGERQPKKEDELSTERVREHRARQRAVQENDETQCNEVKRHETRCNAMKQDETQCNEVKRHETPDKIRGEERIKNLNINLNTASGEDENCSPADIAASPSGAAESSPPAQRPKGKRRKDRPPEGPYYQTKSGAYLTGDMLSGFNRFWAAFDFAKGKAEAADAWLQIAGLTPDLLDWICHAASLEAREREALLAKGQTPKWAQGWLNGRRWEDYPRPEKRQDAAHVPRQESGVPKKQSDADWQKAQETRRNLEAERLRKRDMAITGGAA